MFHNWKVDLIIYITVYGRFVVFGCRHATIYRRTDFRLLSLALEENWPCDTGCCITSFADYQSHNSDHLRLTANNDSHTQASLLMLQIELKKFIAFYSVW